jgi:hypothetical protein
MKSILFRLELCGVTLLLCAGPAAAALPSLFARFSLDREGLYAGEQFQLTLTIYVSGENLDRQITISGLPSPDRLHLDPFQELATETVTLEDRTYETRRFRCRARCLAAGPIVLAPTLQGALVDIVRNYFFVQQRQRPVSVPVESCTLTVKALPDEGRPAGFSGAVGRFALQADAMPRDIAVGDLVTVTLRIIGEGLPDACTPPTVPEAPDIKTYEVKPVPEENNDAQRVFRQTLVPVAATVRAIPAVSFAYFDARQGQYRTLTAGPFPLAFHAERGPTQQIYVPTSGVTAAVSNRAKPTGIAPPPSAGWFTRLQNRLLGRRPATIGGKEDVTVRLAPADSAQPLFTLKPGVAVVIDSAAEGWVRVSCREGIGWVPDTAVTPATP